MIYLKNKDTKNPTLKFHLGATYQDLLDFIQTNNFTQNIIRVTVRMNTIVRTIKTLTYSGNAPQNINSTGLEILSSTPIDRLEITSYDPKTHVEILAVLTNIGQIAETRPVPVLYDYDANTQTFCVTAADAYYQKQAQTTGQDTVKTIPLYDYAAEIQNLMNSLETDNICWQSKLSGRYIIWEDNLDKIFDALIINGFSPTHENLL